MNHVNHPTQCAQRAQGDFHPKTGKSLDPVGNIRQNQEAGRAAVILHAAEDGIPNHMFCGCVERLASDNDDGLIVRLILIIPGYFTARQEPLAISSQRCPCPVTGSQTLGFSRLHNPRQCSHCSSRRRRHEAQQPALTFVGARGLNGIW